MRRQSIFVLLGLLLFCQICKASTNAVVQQENAQPADTNTDPLIHAREMSRTDWLPVYLQKGPQNPIMYSYPLPLELATNGTGGKALLSDFLVHTSSRDEMLSFLQTSNRPLYIDSFEDFHRLYKHHALACGVSKEQQVAGLQQNISENIDQTYHGNLLRQISASQVASGKEPVNQFELHRAQAKYNADLTNFWESIPALPKGQKAVKILRAKLGKYNFDTKSFELNYENLSKRSMPGNKGDFPEAAQLRVESYSLPGPFAYRATVSFDTQTPPDIFFSLPVAEDAAEKFESSTKSFIVYVTGTLLFDRQRYKYLWGDEPETRSFLMLPQEAYFIRIDKDGGRTVTRRLNFHPGTTSMDSAPQQRASSSEASNSAEASPGVRPNAGEGTNWGGDRVTIPKNPRDIGALIRKAELKPASGVLKQEETFEGFACSRDASSACRVRLRIHKVTSVNSIMSTVACTLEAMDKPGVERSLEGRIMHGNSLQLHTSVRQTTTAQSEEVGKDDTMPPPGAFLFKNGTYALRVRLQEADLVGPTLDANAYFLLSRRSP